MTKELVIFVSIFLLFLQGFVLSKTATKSTKSTPEIDEWLTTSSDQLTTEEVESNMTSCSMGNIPDGFYPDEPDTCSATYYVCVSGNLHLQTCSSGFVFDSTVRRCVNHYAAESIACAATYPAPACNADNVGVVLPTARCSTVYYFCLSSTEVPRFGRCHSSNLPDTYFNPVTRCCERTDDVESCELNKRPDSGLAQGRFETRQKF